MKICYFTATGNCLYVAKRIGGELLSIPQLMRSGELEISDDVVGIISPVYAGEMPGMVRDFIGKTKIRADYVFYIYTYGMSESVARPNVIAACQKAELKLDYINAVKMVDNYLRALRHRTRSIPPERRTLRANLIESAETLRSEKRT